LLFTGFSDGFLLLAGGQASEDDDQEGVRQQAQSVT
jgi:hypothetical protein